MRTIKRLLPLLLLPLALTAQAQEPAQVSGLLLSSGQFTPVDMMKYSRNYYSFTTGRVSAMGGAFTALGGDMASMGINPAGIGMYNGSAWGFSPMLNFTGNRNAVQGDANNLVRFGFNNIGTVFNFYNGDRGLLKFNLGVSYNRSDDFNYNGSVRMPMGAQSSLLNIFQLQLNGLYNYINDGAWKGLPEEDLLNDPFNSGKIFIEEWGAVLGYQSGILKPVGQGMYDIHRLPESGELASTLNYMSRGAVSEYNIAGGFNIENIFYFGFDFGFQDIYQDLSLSYSEDYDDDYAGPAQNYLSRMTYNQRITAQGSAYNFKLGVIVRPVPFLRVGLAYHTPTYTTLQKRYSAGMGSSRYGTNAETYNNTLVAVANYSYSTAPRLLSGIAVTVGDYMALSFDYEAVWYNKMRYRMDSPAVQADWAAAIGMDYKVANNFRVGVEVKPVPGIAIRAGYAYYDSPIRDDSQGDDYRIFSDIFTTSSHHISAGLGFWLGSNTTLDLAYVYSRYNVAPYDLYYYHGPARLPNMDAPSVTYQPSSVVTGGILNRHSLTATFNFLF